MAAAVLAGSTYSIGAAAADASGEVRQRVVKFGDLDLTHSAGVSVLYARLQAAARRVCSPENPLELSSVRAVHECERTAITRAVIDVNVPTLTSYHREKMPAAAATPVRLATKTVQRDE
jgi:UrcA family protein